jgi:hypothetical protein
VFIVSPLYQSQILLLCCPASRPASFDVFSIGNYRWLRIGNITYLYKIDQLSSITDAGRGFIVYNEVTNVVLKVSSRKEGGNGVFLPGYGKNTPQPSLLR